MDSALDSALASLRLQSLAEILAELLFNSRYENSTHRRKFIEEWPALLETISHHPSLQRNTEDFGFTSVTTRLVTEVSHLAEKESGWHISARKVHADQLVDFTFDGMASRTQEQAPILSALLDVLLDGNRSRTSIQDSLPEAAPVGGGLDPDEEDYWLDGDLGQEELQSSGQDGGDFGGSSCETAESSSARAERLKKRQVMARNRRVALLAIVRTSPLPCCL